MIAIMCLGLTQVKTRVAQAASIDGTAATCRSS
jgi:hypothetical protein